MQRRASAVGECVPRLMSYKKVHRALCILRKHDWVPGCVLRDLWDQEEEQDAEDIVMDMAAVGWYIQNI